MTPERATRRALREDGGSDSGDPRVAGAVQEYLAALEEGDAPARDAFIARHPEIADELNRCLDALELVHRAALDLRPSDDMLSDEAAGEPRQLPLGDFRIVREIGRGGMGIVYEAVQLSLGRRVALKVLPFVASLDPMRLQRFKNEAQAAAQLHHTHIVPVYAVGSERGVHFYAMQLIEGQALSSIIAHLRQLKGKSTVVTAIKPPAAPASKVVSDRLAGRRSKSADVTAAYPPTAPQAHVETQPPSSTVLTADHAHPARYFRTVASLVAQAASALEHAHRCDVVHRDIKPANLLLDERGNLWMTDFGLAQFHADLQLTRTGDMLGTLRYMSPEQVAGDRGVVDHRTDIYSLGVTLYELLTLEPAFPGNDRQVMMRRIMDDDPASPRALDKDIPIELETVVLKAIAKTPSERYATAQQLADDLERWLEDKPVLARRPTLLERAARWRRRHRALVRGGIVFLFLAMLGSLAGTAIISREHAKTLSAYQREIDQRATAERSFRQAREAVDAFTQLAEEEFSGKPSMMPLRRKFLETSLDYYESFLEERRDDPSLQQELQATSQRVARIVDELAVLTSFAPLMILWDPRVQQELQLSPTQREAIDALTKQLWQQRSQAQASDTLDPESEQKQLADLLRSHEEKTAAILAEGQMRRLRQIALQQQGPFALRRAEVIGALELSADQRKQIEKIIEANGVHHRKPGEFRPPPAPPRRGGPRPPNLAERDPRFVERRAEGPGRPNREPGAGSRQPPPERDDAFDLAAGESNDGKRFDADPPRPRSPRSDEADRGPPWDDHRDEPDDPRRSGPGHPFDKPDSMRATMDRTVEQIVAVLTPAQRVTWQALVGEPFTHDLHFGPDDWLPR